MEDHDVRSVMVHSSQRTHGHRPNQSTSSSRYPRRLPVGDARSAHSGSQGQPSPQNSSNSSGGNDGNGDRGGRGATWEPDENVMACLTCSRRFSAFLRRHHCRQVNVLLVTLTGVDIVEELYVIDARHLALLYLWNDSFGTSYITTTRPATLHGSIGCAIHVFLF
jgi:FYVE zinc finger